MFWINGFVLGTDKNLDINFFIAFQMSVKMIPNFAFTSVEIKETPDSNHLNKE